MAQRRDDDSEMSMEEILASIRKYVADDHIEDKKDDIILELTQPVIADKTPVVTSTVSKQKSNDAPNDSPEELGLTSGTTLSASAMALSKLIQATKPNPVPAQDATANMAGATVEQLTSTLLRPMLKDWLDKNLAPMIESMVSKEIQRLTSQVVK